MNPTERASATAAKSMNTKAWYLYKYASPEVVASENAVIKYNKLQALSVNVHHKLDKTSRDLSHSFILAPTYLDPLKQVPVSES